MGLWWCFRWVFGVNFRRVFGNFVEESLVLLLGGSLVFCKNLWYSVNIFGVTFRWIFGSFVKVFGVNFRWVFGNFVDESLVLLLDGSLVVL